MAPATKGSLGGASFRSAVSATSYRSCVSHASFRSCVSSVYHDCQASPTSGRHAHSLASETFHSLTGHSNEGFQSSLDNVSYYSVTDSLADVPSLPSITVAATPSSGTDKELEEEKPSRTLVYLGYVFAILAGVIFTSSYVLLPQLPALDPWLLLFLRALLQIITMCPIMACVRRNPLGPVKGRWKLPLQSIIGGLLIIAIYVSISRLPHGDLSCMFFITPVLTIVLSSCLLSERCGLYRYLVSGILLLGTLLLARPATLFPVTSHPAKLRPSLLQFNIYGWPVDFANINATLMSAATNTGAATPVEAATSAKLEDVEAGGVDVLGILAAISVPIMSAYLVILIRQCKQVHYSVLMAWFSLGPLIVATVGMFTFGNPKMLDSLKEWLLVLAIMVLGILGNFLMTKAVCWVAPSRVIILRSFEIVAAYILHISVFQLVPAWWDIGGVALVIVAVFAVAIEDLILNRLEIKWL